MPLQDLKSVDAGCPIQLILGAFKLKGSLSKLATNSPGSATTEVCLYWAVFVQDGVWSNSACR